LKIDYALLERQMLSLIDGETDTVAILSNVSALLNQTLNDINWVGFYLLDDEQLVLGPFQGNVACYRIPLGRGVCGTAVAENNTQCVEDVHAFPGHIACDSASQSEIVSPLRISNKVVGVLDIDSPSLKRFDQSDVEGIDSLVASLGEYLANNAHASNSYPKIGL